MERHYQVIVLLVAAAIYLGCIVSPPGLMDDVDAVQAQIARNMLESGDWVTARLNGVAYLEKSPLIYWSMAASYALFGVQDWAARLPLALSVLALCWLTARFARWAFGEAEGLYAGLVMATCVGLWLFTRIQIPDAMLTGTITLALWAFLRVLEPDEPRPGRWATIMAAAMAVGLLLKGLIAMVFPVAAIGLYLVLTKQLGRWRELRPWRALVIIAAIALPWHVAAAIANPPIFDFTMRSEPGKYHGFFWFYFFNEHLFRFLNMRHPRDYNTVARPLFWGFHLLWLFPWSGFFFRALQLPKGGGTRAERTRLLAWCWAGFLLVFFTFSTTQEYYSMPCYPALALLLAGAVGPANKSRYVVTAVAGAATLAIAVITIRVWNLPTPGDIAAALQSQPTEAYTLSLGHMGDLTPQSFAYLRGPLLLAGLAFLAGTIGSLLLRGVRLALALSVMMMLFFHAARLALVAFDPYLGSRILAAELVKQQNRAPGILIVDNQYYTFSSVFFYANLSNGPRALLLNGRVNNLEYGSYAPGAVQVFLDNQQFVQRWKSGQRYYLVCEGPRREQLQQLAGTVYPAGASGGKYLFTNLPLPPGQPSGQ